MQASGSSLFMELVDIDMLIKMGTKLYPEYVWVYNRHKQSDCVFICAVKDDGDLWIHWYEFLIRWIMPKVDIPFSTQWRAFVIDSKDPIKPVYEEFKRRKL